MILLDTNIVSEFMGRAPDRAVAVWMTTLSIADIALPAVVVAEIQAGLMALPIGRRRTGLERDYMSFRAMLSEDQIATFDEAAAIEYGRVLALRTAIGRPIKVSDAQIAAIALARGFTVATRNVTDFEGVGLNVVDPIGARP